MSTRAKVWIVVAVALAFVGAIAGVSVWFAPAAEPLVFSPQGVSNFSSIHLSDSGGSATPNFIANQSGTGKVAEFQDGGTVLMDVRDGGGVVVVQPTSVATTVPGFVVDSEGALGNAVEIRTNTTPVWSSSSAGAVSQSGDLSVSGNVVAAYPTAATTATPGFYANTAADAPDLFVIAKDATPAVFIHNSGEAEFDGNINADGDLDVDGTTNLDDADIDLSASLNIDGHMVDIGTCTTPSTADGEDDLCVAGALEVDGEIEADGNIDADANLDVDGTSNLDEVDIDGVTNLVLDTEHIGIPSVITTTVTYTTENQVIATIGDGELWFVWAAFINVTTNYDCTGNDCTMILGDGADTDGFCSLADAELQTTDAEQTGSPAGWQCLVAATMGVYLDGAVSSAPHIYAPSGADETIDLDVGGTDPAAGAATVYVVYTRIY